VRKLKEHLFEHGRPPLARVPTLLAKSSVVTRCSNRLRPEVVPSPILASSSKMWVQKYRWTRPSASRAMLQRAKYERGRKGTKWASLWVLLGTKEHLTDWLSRQYSSTLLAFYIACTTTENKLRKAKAVTVKLPGKRFQCGCQKCQELTFIPRNITRKNLFIGIHTFASCDKTHFRRLLTQGHVFPYSDIPLTI
jgi:hypothetical protein